MKAENLNNSTIYSVFIRNHSQAGNLQGLIDDLDRINSMGIQTIWLMPIYPIGEVGRKGTLGCPYAVQETKQRHAPSLFEKDNIDFTVRDQAFYDFFVRLIQIKKAPIFDIGRFEIVTSEVKNTLQLAYQNKQSRLVGVFNLKATMKSVKVDTKDGIYKNIINDKMFKIKNGWIAKKDLPAFYYIEQ